MPLRSDLLTQWDVCVYFRGRSCHWAASHYQFPHQSLQAKCELGECLQLLRTETACQSMTCRSFTNQRSTNGLGTRIKLHLQELPCHVPPSHPIQGFGCRLSQLWHPPENSYIKHTVTELGRNIGTYIFLWPVIDHCAHLSSIQSREIHATRCYRTVLRISKLFSILPYVSSLIATRPLHKHGR